MVYWELKKRVVLAELVEHFCWVSLISDVCEFLDMCSPKWLNWGTAKKKKKNYGICNLEVTII